MYRYFTREMAFKAAVYFLWISPPPRELTKPYRKRKNGRRNLEHTRNIKDQGPRTKRSPFNRLVSHNNFGQALNASGLICTAFLSKALSRFNVAFMRLIINCSKASSQARLEGGLE